MVRSGWRVILVVRVPKAQLLQEPSRRLIRWIVSRKERLHSENVECVLDHRSRSLGSIPLSPENPPQVDPNLANSFFRLVGSKPAAPDMLTRGDRKTGQYCMPCDCIVAISPESRSCTCSLEKAPPISLVTSGSPHRAIAKSMSASDHERNPRRSLWRKYVLRPDALPGPGCRIIPFPGARQTPNSGCIYSPAVGL